MRDGRNVMRAGPFLHAWSERELARPRGRFLFFPACTEWTVRPDARTERW